MPAAEAHCHARFFGHDHESARVFRLQRLDASFNAGW